MTAATDDVRRVPLFAGMTDRAIEAIAELATEAHFGDGERLAVEGEPGDALYLVIDGTVRIRRAGSDVRDLGAGDFFGEISLVDGRPRTASATAVGAVRTLEIRREGFLELMDRFSAVRLGVLMALTDRVRSDETADLLC